MRTLRTIIGVLCLFAVIALGSFLAAVVFTLLSGCASVDVAPARYANQRFANVTNYKISYDRTTSGGVSVGGPADDARIDSITTGVSACLATVAEPGPASLCLGSIGRTVDRHSFGVYAPPDVYTSACSGQHLFPCTVDPQLCRDKGLTDSTCACACRGALQDNRSIVVNPELTTYAGDLVRLVTGCNNPWVAPLNACAAVGAR